MSWLELMNLVVRSWPFQRTTEPRTKFNPFTVSWKLDPPAVVLAGTSEEGRGTGLLVVDGGRMSGLLIRTTVP
jgi:hypothetical protein